MTAAIVHLQVTCPLFRKAKLHSEEYLPVSPSQHRILEPPVLLMPNKEESKAQPVKVDRGVIEEFLDRMFANPNLCKSNGNSLFPVKAEAYV